MIHVFKEPQPPGNETFRRAVETELDTGLYFVTLCTHKRAYLFGEIKNGQMVLNDVGQMAMACWRDIPRHFKNVVLHEYIVMPNHIHGIIQFIENPVGAKNISPPGNSANNIWPNDNGTKSIWFSGNRAKNVVPPRGTSKTTGSVVRGVKIGVTQWMRQHTDTFHVWQRNDYKHLLRDERSYLKIARYIVNNPAKWNQDLSHGMKKPHK